MKEFMTYIWILVFGAILTGCASFQKNEDWVLKACKSGVKSYDNGNTSFECFDKTVHQNAHEEGRK